MKKMIKYMVITCIMFSFMSISAFAMDVEVAPKTGTSVMPKSSAGSTISAKDGLYADPAYYVVKYTNSGIAADGQYLVLMVAGDPDSTSLPTITEDSLIYIDQTASGAGSVQFDKVYPKELTDAVIAVAGENLSSSPLIVASVDVQGMLGDVDFSGVVDVGDVTKLVRYVAKLETLDTNQITLGDVDKSEETDIGDVTKLLRYVAKLDPEL